MEFLAGLYTLLLVAICLLQALLLYRTGKPAARQDDAELKEWLRRQLEAQARVLEEKQAQQAQQAIAQQAVYNATNTSTIACLQNQVACLQALTKVVIPATSVCPEPMNIYNSWTAPTATPAA